MPCILKLASEGKKVGFLVAFSWLSYCHTWLLSVAVHGFLLPPMAFCSHPWLFVVTHGFLLSPMALCCHSWLFVATYGFCCHHWFYGHTLLLLPHNTVCSNNWLYRVLLPYMVLCCPPTMLFVTTQGFLLPHIAFCCHPWLSFATHGFLSPPMTFCCHTWLLLPHKAVCSLC